MVDFLVLLQSANDFIIFEELAIVVLNHSINILYFSLNLLGVGQRVQWTYYVFNLCVSNFFPFLLSRHYLLLLSCLRTLLDSYKIFFVKGHAFLRSFDLHTLADAELTIEVFGYDRFFEADEEKGFVFVFEEVTKSGVVGAEVFGEVFVALFWVKELFDAPDAEDGCG